MENNAIEKLKEFAKTTKRKIQIKEEDGQIVVIKDKEDLWFIACNCVFSNGVTTYYSGVFTNAAEPCPSRMSIVKKGFLDHLSFRTGYQTVKIGDAGFDKKTRIISNNPQMAYRLLKSKEAQNLVEQALNLQSGITVSINEIVTEAVPKLKKSAQLSVYLFKDWITDPQEIEQLFLNVSQLKNTFYPED